MIMIVKTPGSQMGSPAAAEEGGEEVGGGRWESGERSEMQARSTLTSTAPKARPRSEEVATLDEVPRISLRVSSKLPLSPSSLLSSVITARTDIGVPGNDGGIRANIGFLVDLFLKKNLGNFASLESVRGNLTRVVKRNHDLELSLSSSHLGDCVHDGMLRASTRSQAHVSTQAPPRLREYDSEAMSKRAKLGGDRGLLSSGLQHAPVPEVYTGNQARERGGGMHAICSMRRVYSML